MVLRHSLTWIAIFVVITLMFLNLPPMVARHDVVLNTYSALVEVDALAKQRFVEPVDGRRLVDGAVRGMMLQLDPYSGYIPPNELAAFERRSAGDYIGVGLELGMRDGRLTVISPIEGSPAGKSGILAGDVLLEVNGQDVKHHSVFEVEDRLVGKPETTVDLKVLRSGEDAPLVFQVQRDHVSVRTVRGFSRDTRGAWSYLIDDDSGIAYVRISNFREGTLRDFDRVLADLSSKNICGLILDLRFNPGGLMDVAIDLVDRFVPEGVILSTVTRRKVVHDYLAHPEANKLDLPLVVLVNRASASSSEIVAGSLQDHHRATIIGERTFGKGSVQHLIPLSDHAAAVKLTVAYYCLPRGRIIHRSPRTTPSDSWGVHPDMEVILTDEEIAAIQRARRTLDAPITANTANENSATGDDSAPPDDLSLARVNNATNSTEPRQSLPVDRQLAAAIDHLRTTLPPANAE